MPEDLAAIMPDVVTIMLQHPDTDMDPVTVVTIPDMVQAMAVIVLATEATTEVVMVDTVTADMEVMAPQEDKPYNTYFIDNPLIIGGRDGCESLSPFLVVNCLFYRHYRLSLYIAFLQVTDQFSL
jgi:hypothetical protein